VKQVLKTALLWCGGFY